MVTGLGIDVIGVEVDAEVEIGTIAADLNKTQTSTGKVELRYHSACAVWIF